MGSVAMSERWRYGKDGRHLHVGKYGGLTLAYHDCPCWVTRGYRSALAPIPGPADEAWAAAIVRLLLLRVVHS